MLVSIGDAQIYVETFGDRDDPAVLLIAGAGVSMDWWEDEFCQRLAAAGHFVIRYDHRDTGQSTSYPLGAPGYDQPTLAYDILAILDDLGIGAAHLVGLSMGGVLAQRLAITSPERVLSLTLMSTSPGGLAGPGREDLPPMAPTLLEQFAKEEPPPDWSNREAAVTALTEGERPFAGAIPFDTEHVRGIAERIVERTQPLTGSHTNHFMMEDGEPIRSQLGQITAPTLVLHGTEDPLFPFGHAEALAREIDGATVVPLVGMGHQYPPPHLWDTVLDAIVAHTARAADRP